MRMPWTPAKSDRPSASQPDQADFFSTSAVPTGEPLLASVDLVEEDPGNPRTEFPDRELQELADDIRARGILQPIIVHRAGADGRYRIRLGAKRLRAAKQAGLSEVPIVVGLADHDAFAQVAENQKRHGLTPLDLARFMRSRVEAVSRTPRSGSGWESTRRPSRTTWHCSPCRRCSTMRSGVAAARRLERFTS
jgi:hypothetical protein